MNEDKPYQFKTFNATYTVNPWSTSVILKLIPAVDESQEIENKLSNMSEYKDAKSVLSKFTQHGQN